MVCVRCAPSPRVVDTVVPLSSLPISHLAADTPTARANDDHGQDENDSSSPKYPTRQSGLAHKQLS